jgi:hypothetical protein
VLASWFFVGLAIQSVVLPAASTGPSQ